MIGEMTMRDFMRVTKALADANRVRTLLALRHGELCVCQITALLGLATSTISKHLSILHQAGLVESRKEGRWIYYQLPGKNAPKAVREAIAWACQTLQSEPGVATDDRELKKLLKMDPVDLCKNLCAK